MADLARRAEEAGWDALFVWDHVTHRKKLRRTIADPWVLLTAAAPTRGRPASSSVTRRVDVPFPQRPERLPHLGLGLGVAW